MESALELVPKALKHHRSVRQWCRRFGRRPEDAILDSNYMHDAMKDIKDADRRGRPDIVHYFLLNVLESPAGKEGLVDVYVHTYQNKLIYVEPETRIPRSYTRFVGIMSQVLRGEDTPRIHPISKSVDELIMEKKKGGAKVVVLDEDGRWALPEDFLEKDTLVIIGGFPHGTFRRIYPSDDRVKIYDKVLPAWTVGSEVTAGWERRFLFPRI